LSKVLASVGLSCGILACAGSTAFLLILMGRQGQGPAEHGAALLGLLLFTILLWFVGLVGGCLALFAIPGRTVGGRDVRSNTIKTWTAIGLGMLNPLLFLLLLGELRALQFPMLWLSRVAKLEGMVVLLFLIWRYAVGSRHPVIQATSGEVPVGQRNHDDDRPEESTVARAGRSAMLRSALIAGGLATLLNPLILVAEATVLFGTGLLESSPGGRASVPFNWFVFVLVGTILLFIPEAIWGLIFGAGFARFGKRGRLAGAISGAIFWFLPWVAGLAVIMSLSGWHNLLESLSWEDYVLPLAILIKEVATGALIGYLVERFCTRHEMNRFGKAAQPAETSAGKLTPSAIAKERWFAKPAVLVGGSVGLIIALMLSAFPIHDRLSRKQACERLRWRALAGGVAARDIEARVISTKSDAERIAGGRYVISLEPLPGTRVIDTASYSQWLPPATGRCFLLERDPRLQLPFPPP
jgi:hypothetical protein